MTQLLAKLAADRISRCITSFAVAGLSWGLLGAVRYQAAPTFNHVHGPEAAVEDSIEESPVEMTSAAAGELLIDAPVAKPAAQLPSRQAKSHTIWMQVTAYCPCKRCCGPSAQGLTASGRAISFNGGRFVAADTHVLHFNTKLIIPGYAGDAAVQVIDRGGAIKGNHIDLFFPSHEQARQWGVKWMAVTVLD